MDDSLKRAIKRRARYLGSMLGPSYWPESDETLDLRKLRLKIIETKELVEEEIALQPCDTGQILGFIKADLKDHISYLNGMLGLDKNGNDKPDRTGPKFKYQKSIDGDGKMIKTKIKI